MQFLIMALETPEAFESRDDPERAGEYWAAWSGYIDALRAAGVMEAAGGLLPPATSTTVRLREGQRLV